MDRSDEWDDAPDGVLRAPFPYMGGKSTVAAEVWARFGNAPNYVEPFMGSAAVLLARPVEHRPWDLIETVNDSDGLLANFWRAVQSDPDAVAHHADWPVSENDLHARHAWLRGQRDSLTARLEGDPDWHDAKAAGWWVWGACSWIASAWCGSSGPWRVIDDPEQGRVLANVGGGQRRQRPHLSTAGLGINRQRPHLSTAGLGINRKLPAELEADTVCDAWADHLRDMMRALSNRLRRVRICCGDWHRVCGPSPTLKAATPCAVFLDPPYANAERAQGCYAHDDGAVASEARAWAVAHGNDPRYRIALCGYDTEHLMPDTWTRYTWKTKGGYSNLGTSRGRDNALRECIWFSPHCTQPQPSLPGC